MCSCARAKLAANLERDAFSSNRHPALSFCLSMILFGKPVPTFPDHALAAEIGPAIGVDRLPRDIARGGAAQKSHQRGDVFGLAAFADQGLMGQMKRRFRLV